MRGCRRSAGLAVTCRAWRVTCAGQLVRGASRGLWSRALSSVPAVQRTSCPAYQLSSVPAVQRTSCPAYHVPLACPAYHGAALAYESVERLGHAVDAHDEQHTPSPRVCVINGARQATEAFLVHSLRPRREVPAALPRRLHGPDRRHHPCQAAPSVETSRAAVPTRRTHTAALPTLIHTRPPYPH
jgi:hypothetical protein